MKTFLARHAVTVFFVLAILLSWLAVAPLLRNPALPVEPFQILGALAGPTLSALLLVALLDGRAGLAAFLRRYVQWRAGLGWWLVTLFGVLAALNVSAALLLGPSVLTRFVESLPEVLPAYLLTLVVGVLLGPLWEEPGWRGFALPRLQERRGPLAASVIIGVVWAVWHLPGYAGGWMTSAFPALVVYCVGFSVVATWVYNHTRGSILLMILLHSSSNAAISVGARVLPADLSPQMRAFVFSGWIPALASGVVATLLLVVTRGTLGHRLPQS
jgi:membrane protease YdiL (CAAX protease family)